MKVLPDILRDLVALVGRYVAFQSVAQRLAVALWIVHTYLVEQFQTTPYLAITSAEKRTNLPNLPSPN